MAKPDLPNKAPIIDGKKPQFKCINAVENQQDLEDALNDDWQLISIVDKVVVLAKRV